MGGAAFTDKGNDAVPGNMVGLTDNITSAEFNADDDNKDIDDDALEDTEVVTLICMDETWEVLLSDGDEVSEETRCTLTATADLRLAGNKFILCSL